MLGLQRQIATAEEAAERTIVTPELPPLQTEYNPPLLEQVAITQLLVQAVILRLQTEEHQIRTADRLQVIALLLPITDLLQAVQEADPTETVEAVHLLTLHQRELQALPAAVAAAAAVAEAAAEVPAVVVAAEAAVNPLHNLPAN